MERINEVLSQEPEIKDVKYPISLENIKGDIRFSKVSFEYDTGKKVLSDISLRIKQSEVMALVGKSGAGKSTLINLLLRFHEPSEGEILVDGHDLKALELKSYRSKIAMVIQDDYLFSGTVAENILYSKPDASRDEMIKATKSANAHQFIIELPDKYETQIGERGVKLSFGQRQRISIARAMLRNPSILILDEATSNVDSETERLIIEDAFKNLMRDRTTIVIAHRLSTISYADNIVFLEAGKVTETGTHEQLLKQKGSYFRMWKEQNKGHIGEVSDFNLNSV
jgi:ABC-type multidrug transport system fused ATPase/permease subunit